MELNFKTWLESLPNARELEDNPGVEFPGEPWRYWDDDFDNKITDYTPSWGYQRQINPQFGQTIQNRPVRTRDVPKRGFQIIQPPKQRKSSKKFENELVKILKNSAIEAGASPSILNTFLKELQALSLEFIDMNRYNSQMPLDSAKNIASMDWFRLPHDVANLASIKLYVKSGDIGKLIQSYLSVLVDNTFREVKQYIAELIDRIFDEYGYYIVSFFPEDIEKELANTKIVVPLDEESLYELRNIVAYDWPKTLKNISAEKHDYQDQKNFLEWFTTEKIIQKSPRLEYYLQSLLKLFNNGAEPEEDKHGQLEPFY